MKIIFAPAKDMDLSNPINKKINTNDKTNKIMESIKKLSDKELIKAFKISESKLEEVKTYISNFNNDTSFKALDLYNGLSYKTLKSKQLSDNALEYINSNMLIFSALYGPISPNKLVKPYRLDFLSRLKIDGDNLKKFWNSDFNDAIDTGDVLLNLASEEFSSLLNQENYDWYDFEFYYKDPKSGELKSHSTNSKKGRGWMVRYLSENNISDLDELRKCDDEFVYSKDLSSDKVFGFIRKD